MQFPSKVGSSTGPISSSHSCANCEKDYADTARTHRNVLVQWPRESGGPECETLRVRQFLANIYYSGVGCLLIDKVAQWSGPVGVRHWHGHYYFRYVPRVTHTARGRKSLFFKPVDPFPSHLALAFGIITSDHHPL